jgi:hypothetical protein
MAVNIENNDNVRDDDVDKTDGGAGVINPDSIVECEPALTDCNLTQNVNKDEKNEDVTLSDARKASADELIRGQSYDESLKGCWALAKRGKGGFLNE